MHRLSRSNVKDIERAQEILRKCDQERRYSRVMLKELDCRERVSSAGVPPITLHECLQKRIMESAKLNPCAAKYMNKQGISSYLKNPVLYTKLLQSVQRKKFTSQAMIGRQFLIQQERLLRQNVDMRDYLGFR